MNINKLGDALDRLPKDLFVVGYPRCGERFLSHNYGDLTGTLVDISHDVNFIKNNKTSAIAIVRDPLDQLASALTVGFYQNGHIYDSSKKSEIDKAIKTYTVFHETILELDSIILVDFEDVINNTVITIRHLANKLGHNYKPARIQTQQEIFELSPKESLYQATSRSLPGYLECYNDLKTKDLSIPYNLYRRCLDRRIVINRKDWIDWGGIYG